MGQGISPVLGMASEAVRGYLRPAVANLVLRADRGSPVRVSFGEGAILVWALTGGEWAHTSPGAAHLAKRVRYALASGNGERELSLDEDDLATIAGALAGDPEVLGALPSPLQDLRRLALMQSEAA